MKSLISILAIVLFSGLSVMAQPVVSAGESEDSLLQRQGSFRRFDFFPAISYSPETRLTLGVIGYHYFNLGGTRELTRRSNVNFLVVFTTLSQIAIESEWDIFTSGNRWRFRGKAFYNRWPDRNYGKGNEAGSLVLEIDEDGKEETFNYLRFNSDRIQFSPVVLRQVRPGLYLGLQAEFETLYRYRELPDDYVFLNADSTRITGLPVKGIRSGLGFHAIWDTRDYVLNPLKGTFASFGTLHNLKAFGSDYTFHSIRLDFRKYLPAFRHHTLALRTVANLRFGAEPIPMRGLSVVGGRDFIRGYFKGTYQDDHLLAFEAEYRLPFWRPEKLDSFWKIWKRLGLVVFAGAAQVFPEGGKPDLGAFHTAVGGGLRILFNAESRVNLRIDYAMALAPDSAGPGKRQSGFYFYLAEAF